MTAEFGFDISHSSLPFYVSHIDLLAGLVSAIKGKSYISSIDIY
jgi:hypothetical protein